MKIETESSQIAWDVYEGYRKKTPQSGGTPTWSITFGAGILPTQTNLVLVRGHGVNLKCPCCGIEAEDVCRSFIYRYMTQYRDDQNL
jgi:hypothetical protein